ncbi:MAG: hypothetical protein JJLCMIEE_02066 [Acidimicrobiales bacterium]|nr:hypothetical protein [Acidimicrobiales bacterium]
MSTTDEMQAPASAPRDEVHETPRDDLLVLIHKALRYGLLQLTIDAGSADWTDPGCVDGLRQQWDTLEHLIRSHASHEDRYIFALLESKQPGAVAELGIGHAAVEAELDEVSARMRTACEKREPGSGLAAYRALTHLVVTALAHFSDEEPVVMERIWAESTDEEIAACRSAFMAEITPDDAVATYELMFPAVSPAELAMVLGAVRAGAPEPVFGSLVGVAERTLTPAAMARLREHLEG